LEILSLLPLPIGLHGLETRMDKRDCRNKNDWTESPPEQQSSRQE
jgi:hypothetical protein